MSSVTMPVTIVTLSPPPSHPQALRELFLYLCYSTYYCIISYIFIYFYLYV